MYNIPLVKNMRIETLLQGKLAHKTVEFLPVHGTTVRDAAQFMKSKKISCVVFMEEEKPAGIMTERDIANIMADHESPGETPVRWVMTHWEKVKTIHVRSTVGDAENDMKNNGVRHGFAVDDNGNLVNVFTFTDLVDAHRQNEELIETQRQ